MYDDCTIVQRFLPENQWWSPNEVHWFLWKDQRLFWKTVSLQVIPFFSVYPWITPPPPWFEHVSIVRFGWNLIYRFILGWYLLRLHFLSEILPPPWIPAPSALTLPFGFEKVSIVRLRYNLVCWIILAWYLWGLYFFAEILPPLNYALLPPVFNTFPLSDSDLFCWFILKY